jgi:ComF family protein
MPLHPKRLKERGYNQAQEIAAPLARALHLPLEHDLLIRSRDTEHQARLTGKARRDNMRNAFSVHGDLTSRHVAVIDDVMTTGASLQAAAKALKQAGAARVDGWVLARTA